MMLASATRLATRLSIIINSCNTLDELTAAADRIKSLGAHDDDLVRAAWAHRRQAIMVDS